MNNISHVIRCLKTYMIVTSDDNVGVISIKNELCNFTYIKDAIYVYYDKCLREVNGQQ